jgi:hypothetical protein
VRSATRFTGKVAAESTAPRRQGGDHPGTECGEPGILDHLLRARLVAEDLECLLNKRGVVAPDDERSSALVTGAKPFDDPRLFELEDALPSHVAVSVECLDVSSCNV